VTTTEHDDEPQPTFADLDIDERVLRALTDAGYEAPSPIQAASIPPLMAGRHLVGLAQTGTGKTAAFAIPILSRIDLNQRAPQALVLAPTRELALQVAEAFGRYAHHIPGLHVLPIYGGQSYGVQLSALRRGAHIIVGTPGRVIDHLEKKTLDLSQLRFLVLDEADEMLQMGFQEDVETILATTPDTKQVALFSATMPAQIRRISKKYLTDAAEITVANRTVTAANTRQRYITVGHQQKLDALTRVLEVESFEAMNGFVHAGSPPPRSTATWPRPSGNGRSASSSRARWTSWWPPTWPPAGWMSSGSAMWSTTTFRTTASRTCTGSAEPGGPDAPARPCCSSPPGNDTC